MSSSEKTGRAERRGFFEQAGWRAYVRKDNSALIIVSAQNYSLHPEGYLRFLGTWKQAQEMGAVGNVNKVVAACREKEIPVIWVTHGRPSGGRDIFPRTFDSALMEKIHESLPGAFLGGTWDAQISDELKFIMTEDEVVLEKTGWGAFEGTPLQRYLNQLGVQVLIICGFNTEHCIESTVRVACDRGFLAVHRWTFSRLSLATRSSSWHHRVPCLMGGSISQGSGIRLPKRVVRHFLEPRNGTSCPRCLPV